jgi:hypothetical protein
VSDFDSGRTRVTADDSAAGLEVDALAGGAITGVNANSQTTIVTYTAPAKKLLSHISVSGTVYAKFQLYKNTVLLETRRGGPDRTLVFEFLRPLKLAATDILDVKVTHYQTGETAEFESTVYGG